MEDLSTPIKTEESKNDLEVIEIYDIFMKDGTHYRFCTSATDQNFLDNEAD